MPEWEVEVSPGGPLVNLSGTIEEVHTELLKLNPDWDTHYLAEKETRGIADTTSSIQKRSFDLSSYFCGGRWPACLWAEIRHGVSYLRGVQGRPVNGAGPGNCGRVSCSYDSAIWWCNDVSSNASPVGSNTNQILRIINPKPWVLSAISPTEHKCCRTTARIIREGPSPVLWCLGKPLPKITGM